MNDLTKEKNVKTFRRLLFALIVVYVFMPWVVGKSDTHMSAFMMLGLSIQLFSVGLMDPHGFMNSLTEDLFLTWMFIWPVVTIAIPVYILHLIKIGKNDYSRFARLMCVPLVFLIITFIVAINNPKGYNLEFGFYVYFVISIGLVVLGEKIGVYYPLSATEGSLEESSSTHGNTVYTAPSVRPTYTKRHSAIISNNKKWYKKEILGIQVRYLIIGVVGILLAYAFFSYAVSGRQVDEKPVAPSEDTVEVVAEENVDQEYVETTSVYSSFVDGLNISPNTIGELSFNTEVAEIVDLISKYQGVTVTPDSYLRLNDISYICSIEGINVKFTASYNGKVGQVYEEDSDENGVTFSGGTVWLEGECPYILGLTIKEDDLINNRVSMEDLTDAIVQHVASLGEAVKYAEHGIVVDAGNRKFITAFMEKGAISVYITFQLPKQNSINMLDKYSLH